MKGFRQFSIFSLATASTFLHVLIAQGAQLVPLKQGPSSPHTVAPHQQIQKIHDIFPPIQIQETINYPLIAAICVAVLVLLLVAFLLFKKWKNKKKQAPTVPPHQEALANLALARAYILENDSLRYAERTSEILRTYIEKRFSIQSTKQTTSEFLTTIASTSSLGVPMFAELAAHQETLSACLSEFDMAKYAHMQSPRAVMETMEETLRHFIEKTIPQEVA